VAPVAGQQGQVVVKRRRADQEVEIRAHTGATRPAHVARSLLLPRAATARSGSPLPPRGRPAWRRRRSPSAARPPSRRPTWRPPACSRRGRPPRRPWARRPRMRPSSRGTRAPPSTPRCRPAPSGARSGRPGR
jgi:hypothetical protein